MVRPPPLLPPSLLLLFGMAKGQEPELRPPSLERFSELRELTVAEVTDRHLCGPMPLLPLSLRTLALNAPRGGQTDAPPWLRIAHLTRLEKLSLHGFASFRTLCGDWDSDQEGPPLPASLAALGLSSSYPIDLGELARGNVTPVAASKPLLSAYAEVVCCSLERLPRAASNSASSAARAEPEADRPPDGLISKLPGGFGALELRTQCITINCSVALPEAGPEEAAQELCLFFGRAPASYRRFSVNSRMGDNPLELRLSFPLGVADPGGTALARQGRVTFTSAEDLAQCMQIYAADHRMSVAVVRRPMSYGPPMMYVEVVRL